MLNWSLHCTMHTSLYLFSQILYFSIGVFSFSVVVVAFAARNRCWYCLFGFTYILKWMCLAGGIFSHYNSIINWNLIDCAKWQSNAEICFSFRNRIRIRIRIRILHELFVNRPLSKHVIRARWLNDLPILYRAVWIKSR